MDQYLTFSPSAINQFNTSLGNLTDVDIILAAASDCRTIAIYEVHGLAARPRRIIRACKFCG